MNEPPVIDESTVIAGGAFNEGTLSASRCLADLPVGARLLVPSRTDWRFATVAAATTERITLVVCSPTGRTYRLRRDPDLPVYLDGHIPIVGNRGTWRISLARYDLRW
jgi:hypothetical protein